MARPQDPPEDIRRRRANDSAHLSENTRGDTLRVAVAHEWLSGYAGSERVVEQIIREYPSADLLTTVLDRSAVPEPLRRARPSVLQFVPGATSHHEWFIPLMPVAWKLRAPVRGVDVVISSSHACAKAVRIAPGIPHFCYCHTPMRYAWHFEMERARFPGALRPLAWTAGRALRGWDRRSARSVTAFAANSTTVADRIRQSYGRTATVIHPPVDTEFFTPDEATTRADRFLYVGRLVSYKRPDLVVEAFRGLPYELVVVGDGHLRRELETRASANVRFAGAVGREELRTLYRSSRALVFAGVEDFGIAMAEALACGTPVVAFAGGGALDIVDEGLSGYLVPEQTPAALRAAVERAAATELDARNIRGRAERFSAARFRRELHAAVARVVAAGA